MKFFVSLFVVSSFFLFSCSSKKSSRGQGAYEATFSEMNTELVKAGVSKEDAKSIVNYTKKNLYVAATMTPVTNFQMANANVIGSVDPKDTVKIQKNIIRNFKDAVASKLGSKKSIGAISSVSKIIKKLTKLTPRTYVSEITIRSMMKFPLAKTEPPSKFEEQTEFDVGELLEALVSAEDLLENRESYTKAMVEVLKSYNKHEDEIVTNTVKSVVKIRLEAAGASQEVIDGYDAEFDQAVVDIDNPPAASPVLAYSASAFAEALAGDGSVSSSVTITLTGDTFTKSSGTFTASTEYTLSGTAVPAGLTAVVTVNSATQATLSFTGNAASHAVGDSVSGITLTFNAAAFTGGAAPTGGSQTHNFAVNFADGISLSYSAEGFTEAPADDGSLAGSVVITLTGNTFSQTSGMFNVGEHFTLTGTAVPVSLNGIVTVNSATQATLTFTGTASSNDASDSVSGITLTFLDAAFTDDNGPTDDSAVQDLSMTFYDSVALAYSATEFNEAVANDGTITETVTITLTGNTFSQASGILDDEEHYTLSGDAIPTGLAAVVTVNSATQATISLTGTAAAHEVSDSVSGITLTFEEAAFTDDDAPVDGSQSQDFAVNFIGAVESELVYSATTFEEDGANDGSISSSVTMTLSGDEFAITEGVFELATHFTLTGTAIPAGLTPILQFLSSTQARLVFTGNAAAHAAGDSVSGVTLTWLPAAFLSGAAPIDGSATQDFAINFSSPSIMMFEVEVPDADFGGRAGADLLCEGAQPIESSHAHVSAFLSVDDDDEILDMPGNYSVPTNQSIRSSMGTVVADDWADLLDGDIDNALIQAGVINGFSFFWWSGSDETGALATNHCTNWTSSSGVGMSGNSGESSDMWIFSGDSGCNANDQSLICIAFD